MSDRSDIPVRVTSGYGTKTHDPFVTLVIGDTMRSFSAPEAIRVGQLLIDVAHAAVADAFLFEFARDVVARGEIEPAVRLLQQFRTYRQERQAAEAR